ncbi:MAG TPA: LCP family protein, partial [Acidimicrobiales bacterium]|nr:LCP family protein [Acidimicrobiales bacterium]
MYLVVAFAGLVTGVVTERLVAPAGRVPTPGAPVPGVRVPVRRGRRRPVGRVLLVAAGVVLLGTVATLVWANSIFNRIEKVEVSDALSSGSGTNYLLVGADNSLSGGAGREGVDGIRADTVMVLRVSGGRATMLSLNRDLWVRNPATGEEGRLNATYNQGPANLVRAVTENFGIPIERYIEIDFDSFSGLVDSFGGIDITFANPAYDLGSGLDVKTAGTVHLDGAQALAYVRSRHYTEVIDGQPVPEGGLPDVNRTMRQQAFLRAVMQKAATNKNPFALLSAAERMSA